MKILMFAHDGSQNRGCEAIVRSTTNIIKEKIEGSKIYLASGKPETDLIINQLDGVYDASLNQIKRFSFDWLFSAIHLKIFKNESYALGKINEKILKHLHDMDVFLSIGGDNYCYGEQPNWYEIDRRVKAKRKKLVLWGCSIGEEDMSEKKLEDLKLFDLILARESMTYQMLVAKGLKNVQLCADPAFTMEKTELPLPYGWKVDDTIGLNYSPLVYKKNPKSKEAVCDLINHILATTDSVIALTPHVMQNENNDFSILEEIHNEFKSTQRIILLPSHLNATEYKGYIARMRFFIGARTHATIAAYSCYVPTIVLGYSVKSRGIAKDLFGKEKLVLNIEDLSVSGKLIMSFNQMLNEESFIIQSLKSSIPRMKKMSREAVVHLEEYLKK
ncbi:polysaccharide pyruvyl transferase family protein [Bacillus haimaensis]|uniref:polysaccharide pyruvyl transferase family protein n=1 Tax=Bacillus haimaensis TaxID=3160967 RepID=UPI003AA8FF2C